VAVNDLPNAVFRAHPDNPLLGMLSVIIESSAVVALVAILVWQSGSSYLRWGDAGHAGGADAVI
jgi:hypothetical protein